MVPSPIPFCLVGILATPVAGLVLRSASTELGGDYFWPTIHGGNASLVSVPFNLGQPTWSWHDPRGFWSALPTATLIDNKKNIILAVADGIIKFSPDGTTLWKYSRKGIETIRQGASLWEGRVICASHEGRAFAVDLETGKELWSTKYARNADGNYGHLAAREGVVIAAGDSSTNLNRKTPSCCGDASHKLVALNATDGHVMWSYQPEVPVWAINPSFADDGTFIYQNLEGTVHRHRLDDGSLIWKALGQPGTWTDGSATIGPNGIVYAVSNTKNGGPNIGYLSAYRLNDGHLLWKTEVPKPPNQAPVIGRLKGQHGLSVVQAMGQQCAEGERMDVEAFNAETGERQWVFEGPTLKQKMVPGDLEGIMERLKTGVQAMTMPHPFGVATIDAGGTVYVGSETGEFFALRDWDQDGRVEGEKEVSIFKTGAAFVGSSGAALAPGMLALSSINQLFVWKFPESA